MDNILLLILITIIISTILNTLLKRFEIPTLIGYIFTGTILTYIIDEEYIHSDGLHLLGEFGITLLMFSIGLEFSFRQFYLMRREVFLFGFLQMLSTGVIFTLISYYFFGFDNKSSIILGFALSLSSTVIILKQLNESGDIHAKFGRKVLGILLFQDLAVIPLLLLITIFTNETLSIGELLMQTALHIVIVFLILFVVGKVAINYLLLLVSQTKSEEIFLTSVFIIVLGSAYLSHTNGFSYSLGAFIAGMLISESDFKYKIEADLIPFKDILLGLFFITVGMHIDIEFIAHNIVYLLILLVGILVLKFGLLYLILRFFAKKTTAFKSALVLSGVGEFAIVIFELASSNHLVEHDVVQLLIVVIVFSMILTPFIFKYIHHLTELIRDKSKHSYVEPIEKKEHYIVCGYNLLGQKLVEHFKQNQIANFVVIEKSIKLVKDGKKRDIPIYFANASQKNTLEAMNIKHSTAIILAMHNIDKIRLVVQVIKEIDSSIKIIACANSAEEVVVLNDLQIDSIININDTIARKIINSSL